MKRSHAKDGRKATNNESFAQENVYAEVIYNDHPNQYDHLRFSYQNNGNSRNIPLNNNNYNRIHQEILQYHHLNLSRRKNLEN